MSLPAGFVFLKQIIPNILEHVRYATTDNFLNKPVVGYTQNHIICTKPAAQALLKVQTQLLALGYQLVVYDGYRPQRAVEEFKAWRHNANESAKAYYYPTLSKMDIFAQDYIAEFSSHSRGSTFDLTLIQQDKTLQPIQVEYRKLNNQATIPFLNDQTLDMGASFDLFHPISHHDSALITPNQAANRHILKQAMQANGFATFPTEWWHYTLINEPYPDTYFDFVPG